MNFDKLERQWESATFARYERLCDEEQAYDDLIEECEQLLGEAFWADHRIGPTVKDKIVHMIAESINEYGEDLKAGYQWDERNGRS